MFQESSSDFGLCCLEFIDEIKDIHHSWSSSIIDSSCVTQFSSHSPAPSMEEGLISAIEEEDDEEMRRRKREELIQYYIKRQEDFKKNPYVCVDAIEHFYYLVPKSKRSKRKFIYYNVESFLKSRGNKKFKIQEFGVIPVSVSEEGKSKVESFLKNAQIQEKGVSKIESLLRKVKIVHKPKREVVLPVEFKNKIQELGVSISKVSMVIEKKLFKTDLSDKHMRFSIPVNQVLNCDEFLKIEEKEILETTDSNNRKSQIEFNLIEPSLEECRIHMAKWTMNTSSTYVLLNDWTSVYKRNNLEIDMTVQLWFFRKDSNRWLALVVVPPTPENNIGETPNATAN